MRGLRLKKVRSTQQPEILQERMVEVKLSHGQEVRTNIKEVFAGEYKRDYTGGVMVNIITIMVCGLIQLFTRRQSIYFCQIKPFNGVETLQPGDKGCIPQTMVMDVSLTKALKRLKIRNLVRFDIVDAIITSNGRVILHADDLTKLVTGQGGERKEVMVLS